MRANELRIGNYAFNKKLNGIIHFKSFYGLCNIESRPDEFEPIPLTEEWLIGFGFKKPSEPPEGYYLLVNGLTFAGLVIDNNVSLWLNYSGTSIVNNIKYVHQLQNLYFALTGEELKIVEE